MLLSEARERVRAFVDADSFTETGDRWSVAEVDQKLKLATEATSTIYAGRGGQRLDQVVDVTSDTDGYVAMNQYKPLQIQSVRVVQGSQFFQVPSVPSGQIRQNASQAWTLKVRLVPTPNFPTSASSQILYGNSTSWELFDELICIRAAKSLLTKDGEIDQSLEQQFSEILNTMLEAENTVKVFDFPQFSGSDQLVRVGFGGLVFDYHPHSLTLGYR